MEKACKIVLFYRKVIKKRRMKSIDSMRRIILT